MKFQNPQEIRLWVNSLTQSWSDNVQMADTNQTGFGSKIIDSTPSKSIKKWVYPVFIFFLEHYSSACIHRNTKTIDRSPKLHGLVSKSKRLVLINDACSSLTIITRYSIVIVINDESNFSNYSQPQALFTHISLITINIH